MAEDTKEKTVLKLNVTQEQWDTIEHLFAYYDWKFDEVESSDLSIPCGADFKPGYIVEQSLTAEECPYCLCKPCITDDSNKQQWWAKEVQPASVHNHKQRKDAFRRFWTMLFHRRVWLDERYLQKKKTGLGSRPTPYSPAELDHDPKFSDKVFFSVEYHSLGSLESY